MAATLESVLKEARQLDARDQVLLAEKLFEGVVETAEHREAWIKEAIRRSKAHKSGDTSSLDAADSIANVRRLIGGED